MHTPAVYLISVLLFIVSGLLLLAAASSWARIARDRNDEEPISRNAFRAAAGLTAASLGLLGAALIWAVATAFFIKV